MKVVFKRCALDDIQSIGDYIAEDSPARSMSFVDEIRRFAMRIGDFPESYPVIKKFGVRQIRRCVFGNYLIFYRISRSRVEVLQVVHGATSPKTWRL